MPNDNKEKKGFSKTSMFLAICVSLSMGFIITVIYNSYKEDTCLAQFKNKVGESALFITTADFNKLNEVHKSSLSNATKLSKSCKDTLSYNQVEKLKYQHAGRIEQIKAFLAQ